MKSESPETKQLQLFDSELQDIPKSRATTLMRVYKQQGQKAMTLRARMFDANRIMTDSIRDHATSAPKQHLAYISYNNQMNRALGIKTVNEANEKQMALRIFLALEFADLKENCHDDQQRSAEKKRVCTAVSEMLKTISEKVAA